MKRVHELQNQQGSTDKTLLDLALNFIEGYGQIGHETLMDCFVKDLEDIAESENTEDTDEDGN